MKKKIIAISLITAMVICNSMTVWAADTWTGSDNTSTYNKNTDGSNADAVTGDGQGGKKNVKGTYNLGTATESYNVEIFWGALTYTMGEAEQGKTISGAWTVDELTGDGYYTITNFPGWVSTGSGADTITVNNKSNVAIKATFSGNVAVTDTAYAIESGTIGFTSLDANNALPLASNEQAQSVPTGSSTVSINGAKLTKAPTLNNSTGLTLGTVTVTIAKQ